MPQLHSRTVTAEERSELDSWKLSRNREQSKRAQVVLLFADGKATQEIAVELECHPTSVKKWIKQFCEFGLDGLHVKKRGPREGPRPSFTRDQINGLLELARTDPTRLGLRFGKWTAQKLANVAVERGIVRSISHVTVQQVLKRHGLRDAVTDNGSADDSRPRSTEYLISGKQALANSEFNKAVECFRSALDAGLHSPEEIAEIRLLLSEAFDEGSMFEEAYSVLEVYEESKTLAPLGPATRGRVKLRIGWVQSLLSNYPRALASINEAKKIFQEIQDEHGIGQAHYALGRTYISISEFSIAREHLVTALTHNGSAGDLELAARIHLTLAAVDYYDGSFDSSKQSALRALHLAEQSNNSSLTGVALLNLGLFHNEPSERKESAEYLRRAIKTLEPIGHKDLALAYNNLGDNLRHSGDWNEAVERLNSAIAAGERGGQPTHVATSRVTLAEVLCTMGRFEEAEVQAKESLDLAGRLGDKFLEGYGLRVLGWIHCSTGRLESAFAMLRQALRVSTLVGDPTLISLSEAVLVEGYLTQGEIEQARDYLEIMRGRLKEEKPQSLFITGIVQRLNGRLDCSLGRYAEGKQHIAQSISIFKKSEIPYEEARSHLAMGELLASADEAGEAQQHVSIAKEMFDALDAAPDSRRASEMMDLFASGNHHLVRSGRTGGTSSGIGPSAGVLTDGPGLAVVRGPVLPIPHRQPARVSGASDALLMQRLIEASGSRELLLQELAAVLHENFQTEAVLICGRDDSGVLNVVVSQGLSLADAQRLTGEIRMTDARSRLSGAEPILIDLKSGNGVRYSASRSKFCLYVKPVEHSPLDLQRLQPLVMQAEMGLELCSLRQGAADRGTATTEYRTQTIMPGFIIGSDAMSRVLERIQKIKTSDVTVLITGESGTGKELVARAVHAESARARAIFLPFNCTATPRDLIESQLFGHRRGAFTGATANYPGMIKAADGGTLFLDEIGDLALEMQPKLMRFLQEGEIQPLGELRPSRVDVRVIAATNSDLERAVDEGRFRKDLFHRLNIIRIHVPALSERREEIPALASFFLDGFASRSGKQGVRLAGEAMEALTEYDWPGNVRQLRNEMERLIAYASSSDLICGDDLSPEVRSAKSKSSISGNGHGNTVRRNAVLSPARLSGRIPSGDEAAPLDGQPAKLKDLTSALELRVITEALARNNNNLSRTAQELGVSRRGLRLKLAQLGIDRNSDVSEAPAAD